MLCKRVARQSQRHLSDKLLTAVASAAATLLTFLKRIRPLRPNRRNLAFHCKFRDQLAPLASFWKTGPLSWAEAMIKVGRGPWENCCSFFQEQRSHDAWLPEHAADGRLSCSCLFASLSSFLCFILRSQPLSASRQRRLADRTLTNAICTSKPPCNSGTWMISRVYVWAPP